MVSMAKVDRAEDYCLTQPIKQLSNMQYGEHIEPHLMVETMVINTHAQLPLFIHINRISAPYGDTLGRIQLRLSSYSVYFLTSAFSA